MRRYPLAAVRRWTVAGVVDLDITVPAGREDEVRAWAAATAAAVRSNAVRVTVTPYSDGAATHEVNPKTEWLLTEAPNSGDAGVDAGGIAAAKTAASRMCLVPFSTVGCHEVAQRDLQRKYDTVYAEYDVIDAPQAWSHVPLRQLRLISYAASKLASRYLAADEEVDVEVAAALGVAVRRCDPHAPFLQTVRGAGAIARVTTTRNDTSWCPKTPTHSTHTTWVVSSGGPSAPPPGYRLGGGFVWTPARAASAESDRYHLAVDLAARPACGEEHKHVCNAGEAWRAHGFAGQFGCMTALSGELAERLHLLTPKGERVVLRLTGLVHRLAYVPLAGWAQEVRQTLLLCRREDGGVWTTDAAGSVLASFSYKSVVGFATGLWTAADGTVSLTVTPAAVAETALVARLSAEQNASCGVTWWLRGRESAGGAK